MNAPALADAAERVLRGETVGSVIRDWTARGIRPVAAAEWSPSSLVGTLVSPRIAGLREWQGHKYPTAQWPAIIDADTHEQLVKLFSDPARRKHITGRKLHLLSGLAPCPKCGHGLKYRKYSSYRSDRADEYEHSTDEEFVQLSFPLTAECIPPQLALTNIRWRQKAASRKVAGSSIDYAAAAVLAALLRTRLHRNRRYVSLLATKSLITFTRKCHGKWLCHVKFAASIKASSSGRRPAKTVGVIVGGSETSGRVDSHDSTGPITDSGWPS